MLWYYDRKEDKYEQRTPKGIAQVRHLYSYDGIDPEQRYALEKAFAQLEDKAAPALLKLQRGEDITQQEHTVISEFVGMQYYRTPVKLDIINEVTDRGAKVAQEVMRRDIEAMSDEKFARFTQRYSEHSGKDASSITKQQLIDHLLKGKLGPDNAKNFQLRMLVDAGTNLGIKFSSRRWLVLHAEPGRQFITSDVGLNIVKDGDTKRETGFGPGAPGMATIFPFAKDTALMITSTLVANVEHVSFNSGMVGVVNAGLARVSGQLYSSDKSLLEGLVEHGKLAKTSFRPSLDDKEMQKLIPDHLL